MLAIDTHMFRYVILIFKIGDLVSEIEDLLYGALKYRKYFALTRFNRLIHHTL